MTKCQQCSAKSTLFLCNPHIAELRDMLNDLPRLAGHLAEAATGQARLGERERRGPSEEQPMRVNLRASDLLDKVNLTLVRWVQDMTEHRGLTYRAMRICPPGAYDGGELYSNEVVSPYDGDAAKLAFWLARNVTAIASGDDAGMCFDEISNAITQILVTINRPTPPRFIGPCPTEHPENGHKRCGVALLAKRDAVEVRCHQCKATHNVELLMRKLLLEVDHWRFTRKEVLLIMATLDDPLSERTFRHWRKVGAVKPCGYRRPDGRDSFTKRSDDDEPLYRLADVRRAKSKTLTTTGS